MHKLLLSAGVLFSLIIATLTAPMSAAARRCEVKMPETLLSLYRNSDAILIGKFDKTEDGDLVREDEDYKVVQLRRYFSVSSALKGEGRKFLMLEEEEYRYKGEPAEAAAETQDTAEEATEPETGGEHAEEEGEEAVEMQPGDTVLLFLKKNEETGKPELTDPSDGIKRLSEEALAAYEGRIRELNAIFSVEKPTAESVVAWLVRTAEDPLTRWEGTFELLQSVERLEYQQIAAKERAERADRGELNEEEELEPDGEIDKLFGDRTIFATVLTDEQKQRLTDVLLAQPAAGEERTAKVRGDRELVELTKRWGDHRVAVRLLADLGNQSDRGYETSMLMDAIAAVLRDEQVTKLADKYRDIYYEDDAASPEETGTAADAVAAGSESGEPAADAVEAVSETERDEPKKVTYRELKDQIVMQFQHRAAASLERRTIAAVAGEDK